MNILIIGAGGHGQVVADILLAQASQTGLKPVGFLDDDPTVQGVSFLGLPVLGKIEDLATIPHDGVIIGIGHNQTRARIFQQLQQAKEKCVSAVHPSAVLGTGVRVGAGVVVCAGVIINTGSRIGDNVILNTGCTVDHHNQIGPHAHIAPGVHLGGDVSVGEGSLIGIGAAVMPQRTVGKWSVIAAGAVVSKDIPSFVTAAGIPARAIARPG